MKRINKLFIAMLAFTGLLLVFQACQKDTAGEQQSVPVEVAPRQYIVVYHETETLKSTASLEYEEGIGLISDFTNQLLSDNQMEGVSPDHHYGYTVSGFSASLSASELSRLKNDQRVKYIEPEVEVSIFQASQTNATWGIDRIDQRSLPLNSTYTYHATGRGVRVYILDTGIRYSHNDFGGRARLGFDAFGGNGNDCNGHGTHVAGTVGGSRYGVAKNAELISVRVLDCNGSGTSSGVIAGMDWVAANAPGPSVANLSLGGGLSRSMDDAVARMVNRGITVVVAAGNSNQDACNYSPARSTVAYTVGATTSSDSRASFSNYGSCVNIFAPGSGITSAWHTSNTAISTISGTSMAAPHVAGVAALYLQNNPSASPQTVYNFLSASSTRNIVRNSLSTNNHLLYSMGGGGSTIVEPGNNPPVASFTNSINNLSVAFNASGSYDTDGSIVNYAWNFGDGTTGNGVSPTRTYAAAGTYNVTLTVTDNQGARGSSSRNITVTELHTGPSLTVNGYKQQGLHKAELKWSGITSASVDIYRDGRRIATVANNGSFTDNINLRGSGSYTYRVCAAGSNTCSNQVSVSI